MTEIKAILRGLGITQKEGEILLVLYATKRSTVAELARQSKIPRTTIYTALASLLEKEIVIRVKTGKRELWEAIPPKRLLMMKQEHVIRLKTIVPDLEQLTMISESMEKSTVVQYKGVRGLQRVYDMILDLGKGERVFGFEGGRSSEKKMSILPQEYSRAWQAEVKRKGIILEVVVSDTLLEIVKSASREMLEAAKGRASITYVLPDDVMNFQSDILVFGHHVAIVTPKQLNAVVITDFMTSFAFKQLISVACQMGKKIDLNAYISQILKGEDIILRDR